jgi:O-antigen/teichoic acid export membrane protein
MYALITLIGVVVTAFFMIGFGLGLKNAIAEYRSGVPESDEMPDYRYGGLAALSVIASAVVIAGAGFSPAMIYAGPLLALVTAAGCGLAFFVEDKAVG